MNNTEFNEIVSEMVNIHNMKEHDYAGEEYLSNFKASHRMGLLPWKGVLARMQDKMSRIENFAKQDELSVKDESVEDTLKDLACYSIICLILYRDSKQK